MLIPEAQTLDKVERHRWDPVMWAMQLFKQPKGMGILCDPDHPAFKGFPTDFHSDWQWRSLLDQSEALVYMDMPAGFSPIIQVVPDFNTNLPMSLLMELSVEKGSLMICTIDLLNRDSDPLATNALLRSLLDYMGSSSFRPANGIPMEQLEELLAPSPSYGFESEQPDFSAAVVNIQAAGRATIGTNERWTPESKADEIIALGEDFTYHVDGSLFRDHNQGIWYDRDLKVSLTCTPGFSGSFYVFMKDQYEEGRAAHLWFCGQDKGQLLRYDRGGTWLKYAITPGMTAGGEILFRANTMNGPNATVRQIVLIAD
jgi:hypothetical protein